MIKSKKNLIIYFILLVFISLYFKFFENFYILLKYNYETRLTSNYGYCEKNSYGFIKYIDKKYKLIKNIHIFNDDRSFPYSEAFIHKPKKEYDENYLIILNYNEQNSRINLENFEIIEKFKNCFFLKKND